VEAAAAAENRYKFQGGIIFHGGSHGENIWDTGGGGAAASINFTGGIAFQWGTVSFHGVETFVTLLRPLRREAATAWPI